ncbi:MAG: hemerythrin domain-containing protein [Ornithinibacter sp.]
MAIPTDPDLTMNTVIHRALRRDLERLEVVTREPVPDAQRLALCRHVTWMLDILHHHHVAEDEGVWPRLVAKRPDAAPLVEQMNAEHHTLAEASDAFRAAADAWSADASDDARRRVHDAVVTLQGATIPHLDHEEREAMPVAVDAFDEADWAYLNKNYFRKGLSLADNGWSLMWFMDAVSPEYAAVVRSEIPPPVLWMMTRGFGKRYDREAAVRWGPLAGTRA